MTDRSLIVSELVPVLVTRIAPSSNCVSPAMQGSPVAANKATPESPHHGDGKKGVGLRLSA